MNVSVYSPILEKGVFLGFSLYRGLNTCYRRYRHDSPVGKNADRMRYDMPAVDECEGGGGVRRGHDRHDRSRSRPTASMDGEWRPARTSFRVRDESRPEGRSFGPQGRMPPIGLWAVGTNEPHARDKTVHGRCGRRMVADIDKFPHLGRKPSRGAFIQLTGANAGHRVGNDLREVGTDKLPRSG